MSEIFEFIMLACFGMSWPISVWKSIKSRSTKGGRRSIVQDLKSSAAFFATGR